MKKTISIVLILAALAIAAGAVMYFWPKEVAMNAQGIQYRLGDDSASLEQPLNVRIEGKAYKSITGQRTFKGIIDLDMEGLDIPIPDNQRKLEISIDKHNRGMLQYSDTENGMALPHFVGELYVNKEFSKVAIALLDHEEGRGGWSGDSGAMIAAPASSRTEALEVSNALMSPALDGYTLR